jgi:endonuclease G
VFADDDREYRGILLPEKFFKIAVWMSRGELAATAYVLDQESLLDGLDARGFRATRLVGRVGLSTPRAEDRESYDERQQ